MSKQYLISARDTEDAHNAIQRIPGVVESGDEVILLIVSPIPSAELIGTAPPVHVLDPMMTTGGTVSAGRAGADQPEFIGREEIMELRRQELCESVNPQIAGLHDRGYAARVEAVFSDDPGETIRDYAGDLNVTDVYATQAYRDELDSEAQEVIKTL